MTLRLAAGLPSLRRGRTFGVLLECFRRAKVRFGARLVHYAVMGNHMHLILEAPDRGALARAMQGLKIRVAKRLNALWKRAGIVFAERYHAHVLRTPTEVRNALCYVLNNARKHGLKLIGALDPFASGAFFDGWMGRREALVEIADDSPVAAPLSWVVTVGWRKARRPITPTWGSPPGTS